MAYQFREGKPVYLAFKNGLVVLKSSYDAKLYTDEHKARSYNPTAKIIKYVPENDESLNVIKCMNCKWWQSDTNLRVYCMSPRWGKKLETAADDFCSYAELKPIREE